MNKLTEVTRRDLIDIIKSGFVIYLDEPYKDYKTGEYIYEEEIRIPIYGRLSELDFLSRLYNLESMPSTDSRFSNASGDIWQHTINNDDWEPYWFFGDSRFNLLSGDDEYLLKFICEMLNPAVRIETSNWKLYVKKFNELLRPDGYELSVRSHISGRDVFISTEIDSIEINNTSEKIYSSLKLIGEGSYAQVFKYKDAFYNKKFALKRAKKDLNEKELERFKREFEQMKSLSSPYIVEVYSFNEETTEYMLGHTSAVGYNCVQSNCYGELSYPLCSNINETLKKCKKVNKGNDVTYIVDEDDSIELYKKFYTLCFLRIAGEKNFKEYLRISGLFVSKNDKKEMSAECDERINEIVTLCK